MITSVKLIFSILHQINVLLFNQRLIKLQSQPLLQNATTYVQISFLNNITLKHTEN